MRVLLYGERDVEIREGAEAVLAIAGLSRYGLVVVFNRDRGGRDVVVGNEHFFDGKQFQHSELLTRYIASGEGVRPAPKWRATPCGKYAGEPEGWQWFGAWGVNEAMKSALQQLIRGALGVSTTT
ncbi:MAG TPA: hypothetical protein QF873_02710 [Patescibacteria group bacterium]|nr:hypothetical protein [Patescibacteria group bacterium]